MPLSAVKSLEVAEFPMVVPDLDDRMGEMGFVVSEDGLAFSKTVVLSDNGSRVSIVVASETADTVDGINIEVTVPDHVNPIGAIRTADRWATPEGARIGRRFAQLGYPGGSGGLWNVNQDEGVGGPRWWLYDQMSPDLHDLEKWIQGQFRYNPSYMMTPDVMPEESHYEPIATIDGEVDAVRFLRDRQEVVLEVRVGDKTNKIKMPSWGSSESDGPKGELAQELDKYVPSIVHTGTGKSVIFITKTDERGDNKGIWEINGKPAAGIAYIDEDGNSPSLHPQLLDDKQWTQGIGPGVVGYIPKY